VPKQQSRTQQGEASARAHESAEDGGNSGDADLIPSPVKSFSNEVLDKGLEPLVFNERSFDFGMSWRLRRQATNQVADGLKQPYE
jgi:hypothetical protein